MNTRKRFSILSVVLAIATVFGSQSFAGGHNCGNNNDCTEPFDQVASGFSEASVNKHFDNGTDKIGVNGDGYSRANYDAKSATKAEGSAEVSSTFSYALFSNENSADISAKTKSEGNAETSPINGSSVVGQESYAKQSNGATIVNDDNNGFSAGNMTYAKTSGEKKQDCGSGTSIVGNSEASGYTKGEMTSGDDFRKTTVETGGNSQAVGMESFVKGDGSYGGNASITKNGASAYGEISGVWKYSGPSSGSGVGSGSAETTITETANSIGAVSKTQSYSAASASGK